MTLEFFASASKNTESALCDELRELGFQSVRLNRGGIPFRGDWSEGWRACLESRIAQRIMVLMGRGSRLPSWRSDGPQEFGALLRAPEGNALRFGMLAKQIQEVQLHGRVRRWVKQAIRGLRRWPQW